MNITYAFCLAYQALNTYKIYLSSFQQKMRLQRIWIYEDICLFYSSLKSL